MPHPQLYPPPPPPQPQAEAGRIYINSWAARTTQRLAGRVIDSLLAFGCVLLVIVIGPHGRPFAQDLMIVALMVAIESLSLTRKGATLGMQVAGIRVAVVGSSQRVDWTTAARRSVPVALSYTLFLPFTPLVVVMPLALFASIAMSPQHRGFHDRLSDTVVVQGAAPEIITDAAMETWWQGGRGVVMSPWGRVPDLFDRRRARAHRLDGAWWLAGVIMIATIASVGIREVAWLWLWLTLAWIVLVTADESWRLADHGATPGHERFKYQVVDLSTGQPPSVGRAVARSVVLAFFLYVPPLQGLLALWVNGSSLNRGPHDLVARTIVVEPDYEPPTFVAPPQTSLPPYPFPLRPSRPLPPPPLQYRPPPSPWNQPPPSFQPGPF